MVRSVDVSIRQEDLMPTALPEWPETLERRTMSFDEFEALPEKLRAEYVDGEAIVSPPASMPHNAIGLRLAMLLQGALPDLHVGYDMGVITGPRRRRIPDLAVVDHVEPVHWTDQTPYLVVEILSPTTRSEDTLRKSPEYAAAGVGQFWIVDPDHHTLTVLGRDDGSWDIVLELDADHPRGEVPVGEHGVVTLDLDELLVP
jgi:Uma2 family endonuclease